MFYYYNPLLTTSGDILPDYLVRLLDANGNEVDIFADDSGTPIVTASGVANAAKADALGMIRFWVPNGTYDITIYDTTDTFKGSEIGVPMYDAGTLTTDLAEETGGALIGTKKTLPFFVDPETVATYARTVAADLADARSILDLLSPAKQATLLAGTQTDCTDELVAAGLTGIVYSVPPGADILVTEPIVRTNGFGLIGETAWGDGIATITFDPDVSYTEGGLFTGDGVRNNRLFGLKLIGPGYADGRELYAIREDGASSDFQNVYEFNDIREWPMGGALLSGQWQGTFRNNYIRRCGNTGSPAAHTGGIVIAEHPALANWGGSGWSISDNYYVLCSYGIYNDSGWNFISTNDVFEYNTYPFYKSANGTMMTLNAPWFENNTNPPAISGPVYIVSGRGVSWAGMDDSIYSKGIHVTDAGINFYAGLGGDPTTPRLSLSPDGVLLKVADAVKSSANLAANANFRRISGVEGYARYISNPTMAKTTGTITAATAANPVVLTVASTTGANALVTGDRVTISGVVGMTELNGLTSRVTVSGTTVTLSDINGSAFSAYSSGGTWTSDRPIDRVAGVYVHARSSGSGAGRGYGRVVIETGEHNGTLDNNVQPRWEWSETGHFLPAATNTYDIGSSTVRVKITYTDSLRIGSAGATVATGSGSPEGAVTGTIGSLYTRNNGGSVPGLYLKASGTGNTGWQGLQLAVAAYTATNVTTDRSFDADTVALAELADVVGTLIADLKTAGLFT